MPGAVNENGYYAPVYQETPLQERCTCRHCGVSIVLVELVTGKGHAWVDRTGWSRKQDGCPRHEPTNATTLKSLLQVLDDTA